MICRRAEQAGYTITQISQMGGHSLRAGFVTKAFRAGADAHQIMRQTGHRSHAVLETYAREPATVANAVSRIGLQKVTLARAGSWAPRTHATHAADWAVFVDLC